MKLIRFGEPGRERPGVLLSDGTRLNVSAFGSDFNEAFLGGAGIARLAEWVEQNKGVAPRVTPSVRWGPPICRPSNSTRSSITKP